MGLLGRLLTLPLEPVRGMTWVGDQLLSAAEQEYYDEARIRRQLLELEEDLEAGRISEADYDAAEEELIGRLLEAQQFAQPEAQEAPEAPEVAEHVQHGKPRRQRGGAPSRRNDRRRGR